MRAAPAPRIEPVSARISQFLRSGWKQAGFSSFAYRLAHLRTGRLTVVGTLALVFVFA